MNKTQRILRYLSIHGPATSRQIADALNMEKTGHVAALLRGYREKGRVLYNADMIWSISPEYDAQRSADIMAAVDLLKRAGYTVAPACEKRQPTRVMQERCAGREAECEKLRKDAERYRWLRRGGNDDIGVVMGFDGIDCGSTSVAYTYEEGLCGERMDAAIDAAMELTK